MTPAEKLVHYAAENAAIIYGLMFLVIILGAGVVWLGILYGLKILETRGFRRREERLAKELALRADELVRLRELVGDVEALKKDLKRNVLLRDKAFKRLEEQNEIVATQNGRIKRRDIRLLDQASQIETLKGMLAAHAAGLQPGSQK